MPGPTAWIPQAPGEAVAGGHMGPACSALSYSVVEAALGMVEVAKASGTGIGATSEIHGHVHAVGEALMCDSQD